MTMIKYYYDYDQNIIMTMIKYSISILIISCIVAHNQLHCCSFINHAFCLEKRNTVLWSQRTACGDLRHHTLQHAGPLTIQLRKELVLDCVFCSSVSIPNQNQLDIHQRAHCENGVRHRFEKHYNSQHNFTKTKAL